MNTKHNETKFATMGARFRVSITSVAAPAGNDYAVDIRRDGCGEFFELRASKNLADVLDVSVSQSDKRDRHLLLFVRRPEGKLDRFLCGHDERAWFVAAVPGGASTVTQAKDALKPRAIRLRERQLEVPTRLKNRRKNAAFLRQGEWFFVPASAWSRDPINERFVLRNEPLRRGAGKPHVVEELYRAGGEVVYVCSEHPNGVNEAQYRKMLQNNPNAARWGWQVLRRNPRVYARGTVRHADHATIRLPDWHRVVLNTETETDTMRNVAFID